MIRFAYMFSVVKNVYIISFFTPHCKPFFEIFPCSNRQRIPANPPRRLRQELQSISGSAVTLNRLAALAHRSPDHGNVISRAVRTFLFSTESPPLAVESLDTLASIPGNEEICDGSLFVSLCFDSLPPSLLLLLRHAGRFRFQPYLLFTVFLGFTKDPYPCVRKAALDGLISLSRAGAVEGHSLITRCHHGAVELLGDSEACVRVPAIQTASEWEEILAEVSARGTN
ncbi:hypothetical protein SAY87_008368 [Trapa incisa]|uniref:Uncharacterized protein n=1 Tax=Trapa incisa TaxID=236973 RepID=A0AAN7QFY3_9MYRT|nr:hypothetical protein SAY87_008368 [Trapa incisa]